MNCVCFSWLTYHLFVVQIMCDNTEPQTHSVIKLSIDNFKMISRQSARADICFLSYLTITTQDMKKSTHKHTHTSWFVFSFSALNNFVGIFTLLICYTDSGIITSNVIFSGYQYLSKQPTFKTVFFFLHNCALERAL